MIDWIGPGLESLPAWRRPWFPPERIRQYQEQALRRLLTRAVPATPYYARLFRESGLDPASIRELSDLRRIPVSAKSNLQGVPFADRFSEGASPERCRIHESSGSTGEPILIARTTGENLRLFGRRLRAQILSGLRPGMRRAILGAGPQLNLAHRLGIFPLTNVSLTENPESIMARLERDRPHILKGPPGTLELLTARYPDRIRALGLRRIFTGAEQLPRRTREMLEKAGGCPVVDFYGAIECNLIAWECSRCGLYHTSDDSVIVEILNGDRPAEPGEDGDVVITVLDSYAMPLIRYRLGDVVRLPAKRPMCKIGFGTIERIQGRSADYLELDGNLLSPYVVMDVLDLVPGIQRYQVLQPSADRIVVRCQLSEHVTQTEVIRRAVAGLREVIPAAVQLALEPADHLEFQPDRKRRIVVREYA